jgi:hypothetical protein
MSLMDGNMQLHTMPYTEQATAWPTHGRHILAQFHADTIVADAVVAARIGVNLQPQAGST